MRHAKQTEWISIEEATRISGIGRSTIYSLIKQRKLRSQTLGGRRMIDRQLLEDQDLSKAAAILRGKPMVAALDDRGTSLFHQLFAGLPRPGEDFPKEKRLDVLKAIVALFDVWYGREPIDFS